jgi:hypothetical protein
MDWDLLMHAVVAFAAGFGLAKSFFASRLAHAADTKAEEAHALSQKLSDDMERWKLVMCRRNGYDHATGQEVA